MYVCILELLRSPMNETNFVDLLQTILENEGYLTQREVGVGYGVADLVIIKKSGVNTTNCKIRNTHRQLTPLLGEEYFRTLDHLPDEEHPYNGVEFSYIAEKSSLSRSYLKQTILRDLERYGYVKCINDKYYVKVNGWLPIANEMIAIEAKMTDWRRGVLQANRYKAFANRVYLAIPSGKSHLVDIPYLRNHNIGLIVVDTEHRSKWFAVGCSPETPFASRPLMKIA